MQYIIQYNAPYLSHHGIKGQKWGVRRYQNEDGTLTEAGKKRYDRLNSKGKYDKYKESGLTIEDQFTARQNSDKIKKTAIIVGGLALTAGAAYLGRQYVANNIDTVMKSGSTFQTIMNTDNIDTGRQFYASINGLDKLRYGAISFQQGGDSKKHQFEVTEEFKIASNKSAANVFQNLYDKDLEFHNAVNDEISNVVPLANLDPFHGRAIGKAAKEINTGNVKKNVYDMFNVQLADGGVDAGIKDKFFSALKSSGYAGLKDVNDVKFTNYRSINPVILTDVKDKIANTSIKDLTKKESSLGIAVVIGQGVATKLLALPAAAFATTAIVSKASSNKRDEKLVAEYRKEHPNSTKTYNEILDTVKYG